MAYTKAELKKVRETLEAQLETLRNLQAATKQDRAPVELDQASVGRLSRMDAMQVQAMAKASHQRRVIEERNLLSAMARLDEGEFGACVVCGEDIDARRLAIDLMAITCISCANGNKDR